MEPPVTLSIIDMSQPTITYQEAYRRIEDAANTLLDGCECELRAEEYIHSYKRLDRSEERHILANVFKITFDAESGLANINEDDWYDSDNYDELCSKLEWYFNNGKLDNYPNREETT